MKNIKMKTILKISIIVFFLILIKTLFFSPGNYPVNEKLRLIKNEISKRGYTNNWFIISGKRHSWYNNLLSNSAKESYHLKGDAIDIYVFDLNSDGIFNSEDIKIFESVNKYVESTNPELVGALGTYTTKGYFSRHMIHIDTRGYKKRYNK
jgi:uncharacterized protein YcbK (DUF882 family)